MQARQDLGVALGFFVGENGTGTGVTIQSSPSSFLALPGGPVPAQPGSAGGLARPWLPVTQWLGWSSAVPRCFGWMQT